MRIRRMELQGFKSFADRTVLTFGPGVSALVGPNGCGKSNVVDALRWVLGEQAPSTLRGRGMEDLIFAGAERRPAGGFAEVQVAFDNADGRFPGPLAKFTEVEIGRRLHRNGDSDYKVNRATVRLKDITSLFLDSGVGARAYSIIEQGNVGFVISARPEERRVLIDETAGVNRFRVQRAEAEQRMGQSRENLRRVHDVEEELGRQRRALEAQAARAQNWRSLRRRQREAALRALLGEAILQHADLRATEAEVDRLRADGKLAGEVAEREAADWAEAGRALQASREREREIDARRAAALGERAVAEKERELKEEERRRLDEGLGRRHRDVADSEARQGQLREDELRLTRVAEERRRELQSSREAVAQAQVAEGLTRSDLRTARDALEAGKNGALDALSDLTRERNALAVARARHGDAVHRQEGQLRRVEEAGAQLGVARDADVRMEGALTEARSRARQLRDEFERGESEIAEARRRVSDAQTARDRVDQAHRRVSARWESLTQLLSTHEGVDDGARAVLRAHEGRTPGVLGLAADLVDVAREGEDILGTAVGELLQAVVVQDEATLLDLRREIEARALPRTRLFSLDVADTDGPGDAVGGWVRDRPSAPGLAARLFSGIEPSEATRAGPGQILLGPWGRRVDERGTVVGTDKGRGASVLARRREARDLEAEVAALAIQLGEHVATWESLRQDLLRREADREARRGRVQEAEILELGRRRDVEEAKKERRRLEEAVERAEREREASRSLLDTLAREAERAEAKLPPLRARHEQAEAQVVVLRDRLLAAEHAAEEALRQHQALRLAQANAEHGLSSVERDRGRLAPQRADLERRLERERAELAATLERLKFLTEDLQRVHDERGEKDRQVSTLEEDLARAAEERHSDELKEGARRAAAADAARRRDDIGRPRDAAELRLARQGASWEALQGQANADHDLDLLAIVEGLQGDGAAEVPLRGVDGPPMPVRGADLGSRNAVRRATDEACARQVEIEALGPVHLGAAEELSDVERRLSDLAAQRTDIERALGDLESAIARLERETVDRFRKAFEAVQERFSALYPRLVGGGRAELRLTRPDRLLETGVDILVEPPGKRPQNLALLSGGEKAMAAIALVFAVFQVKPSPFCLLDEVDAPLDEANSRRFNEMIRELSSDTQFVLITHNRTTMEVADVLYGITTQEPGVSTVVAVRLDPGRPLET